MIFFQNIVKIIISQRFFKELRPSVNQLRPLEKLIIFHDKGAFSTLFLLSSFFHIILIISFGVISEMFVEVPPPIRAKIGVSYAKIPINQLLKKNQILFLKNLF